MSKEKRAPNSDDFHKSAPVEFQGPSDSAGNLDRPDKVRKELGQMFPFLGETSDSGVSSATRAGQGGSKAAFLQPNEQTDLWRSEFGADYAERGNNRVSAEGQRRLMRDWGRILDHAVTPSPESALEVGCNIGRNLIALRSFIPELFGVDPNPKACKAAQARPELSSVEIVESDGFSLPFQDDSMDLVFTSGVLIHVSPDKLGSIVDEIVRVSRRYVLCIEYFSHQPEAVNYRGMSGQLFKRDFGRFYLERYPGLRVVDYGFLWQVLDSSDNSNWWLFSKE